MRCKRAEKDRKRIEFLERSVDSLKLLYSEARKCNIDLCDQLIQSEIRIADLEEQLKEYQDASIQS